MELAWTQTQRRLQHWQKALEATEENGQLEQRFRMIWR